MHIPFEVFLKSFLIDDHNKKTEIIEKLTVPHDDISRIKDKIKTLDALITESR